MAKIAIFFARVEELCGPARRQKITIGTETILLNPHPPQRLGHTNKTFTLDVSRHAFIDKNNIKSLWQSERGQSVHRYKLRIILQHNSIRNCLFGEHFPNPDMREKTADRALVPRPRSVRQHRTDL